MLIAVRYKHSCRTQNLAFFTERVGSTPTSATIYKWTVDCTGLPELLMLIVLPIALAVLAF